MNEFKDIQNGIKRLLLIVTDQIDGDESTPGEHQLMTEFRNVMNKYADIFENFNSEDDS